MTNFEVDPFMMDKVEMIVFHDEFIRNVGEFDADILRMIEESFEIEVSDVEADEFCAWAREDNFDLNIEGFN